MEQAPAAIVLAGGLVTPPLSSVSVTFVSVMLPVLQTWPEKVTSTPSPAEFTTAVQSLVTVIRGWQTAKL